MRTTILIAAMAYMPLMAQDAPVSRWLTLSQGALVAGQAADAITTIRGVRLGYQEANPLGANGVLVAKAALTPLTIWEQRRVARAHPKAAKWMAIINWAVAGEVGAMAWRNARLVSAR